jgi:hypothetical protein
MFTSDPKLRDYLRDLPTGYLLALLADQQSPHRTAIREILWERGLPAEEVDALVQRRRDSRMPPIHTLWRLGRKITLVSTLLICCFNLYVYYRILHGDHSLKGLLIVLSVGCLGFGFYIGYKLSIHIYQGDSHRLNCGFPLPVGSVDLETGEESTLSKPAMIVALAGNALVGLVLMLFPLLLLYHLLT